MIYSFSGLLAVMLGMKLGGDVPFSKVMLLSCAHHLGRVLFSYMYNEFCLILSDFWSFMPKLFFLSFFSNQSHSCLETLLMAF
jgi:hypothetical protein